MKLSHVANRRAKAAVKLTAMVASDQAKTITMAMGRAQDRQVSQNFFCNDLRLTSLEGGPQEVAGSFSCSNNLLTSLEFGPRIVNGNFSCAGNFLTSLEHAPEKIGDSFSAQFNELTSLKGVEKHLKGLNGYLNINKNPIKSHMLGLLKIKGLRLIIFSESKIEDIFNKHLAGDRNLLACQEDLLEAGYEAHAQL